MLFQRIELQNEKKLAQLFPPELSDDEWRARLAQIQHRYRRGEAARATFALATAAVVAITLPPYSLVQLLGIIGVGVMFLVTRSTGNAKLANLERRLDYMIEQRSAPRGRDDQPSS